MGYKCNVLRPRMHVSLPHGQRRGGHASTPQFTVSWLVGTTKPLSLHPAAKQGRASACSSGVHHLCAWPLSVVSQSLRNGQARAIRLHFPWRIAPAQPHIPPSRQPREKRCVSQNTSHALPHARTQASYTHMHPLPALSSPTPARYAPAPAWSGAAAVLTAPHRTPRQCSRGRGQHQRHVQQQPAEGADHHHHPCSSRPGTWRPPAPALAQRRTARGRPFFQWLNLGRHQAREQTQHRYHRARRPWQGVCSVASFFWL